MKYIDKVISETKWLRFLTRYYTGKNGEVMAWDFIERTNKTEAVVVVAKTKETKSFIIIKQFRATFNDYIYEFPAGLIDDKETAGQAALRELEEETGFRGKVISVSNKLSSSAGLTSETVYLAHAECDEEPKSQVRLEVSEDIEVMKLHPEQIHSFLSNNKNIIGETMYGVLSISIL